MVVQAWIKIEFFRSGCPEFLVHLIGRGNLLITKKKSTKQAAMSKKKYELKS